MPMKIWPTAAEAIAHARHVAQPPLAWDPVSHLLSRFTFGPTPVDRAWVTKNGPDAWYATQVQLAAANVGYAGIDPAVLEQIGPLVPLDINDRLVTMSRAGRSSMGDALDQTSDVTIALELYSPAQLYETLVDFWGNHLNVTLHDNMLWGTRPSYDQDVIRANATGSFTDMLLASAKDPSMLIYLNLAESLKTAINENYGRELLELHTVGLHYSQSDVTNAATLLTGRGVTPYYQYKYDPTNHPTGAVQVLGFKHPNSSPTDGETGGDALLTYLATHEYTAQHIAQKICTRYVSDTPSAALIDAVAQAYLDGGTQTLPMVKTILCSTEFWESRGEKVRRPAENLFAAIRALGVQVADWSKATEQLYFMLRDLGDAPFEWVPPNGYPDTADQWSSAGGMLQMWQYHYGFAANWWSCFGRVDPSVFFAGASTSGEAIDALTTSILGMRFATKHRAVLLNFLNEPASTPIGKSAIRTLIVPLIGLILNGPHHALR